MKAWLRIDAFAEQPWNERNLMRVSEPNEPSER